MASQSARRSRDAPSEVPGSLLPDQLRELGYIVERTGETERILPNTVIAMVETYDLRVPPAAAAPIPGSLKPKR